MRPYVEEKLNINQLIIFENVSTKDEEGQQKGDDMGPKSHQERNKGVRVSAPLPDAIPFAIGNEVNEIFDFLKIRSKLVQLGTLGAARVNLDRGLAERQFWRGIINQDISVDLTFNAYYSGKIDVIDPVGKLLLMAAPLESNWAGGSALNPGILGGYWKAPPRISVRFGNIIWFANVIIKTVNVQWSNKLDSNFDPLSATVSVTFITQDPMGYGAIFSQSKIDIPREGVWERATRLQNEANAKKK